MYIFVVFATTFIFSVLLSVSAEDSDLTFPLDDSLQTDLSNIPLDMSLDSKSLFDTDITSPQILEAFDFFSSEQSEPNSSDLLWDDVDPFQLADCSMSENSALLPPALGKSRVRRIDDGGSSSCANPNAAMSESNPSKGGGTTQVWLQRQAFDNAKHSETCWEITAGLLPFAVLRTGDIHDQIRDDSRIFMLEFPLHPSPLVIVYRVTPCT